MPIESYREAAVFLLVCSAAVNDLATRRIPNRLLLVGLACAFAVSLAAPAPGSALLAALGGLATGLAMLLPFYLLRGMAAGDVKLRAVVGAFVGLDDVLCIVVLTWCVGGAMALGVVVLRGRVRLAAGNLGRMLLGLGVARAGGQSLPLQSAGSIPYGVAIAAGTIATLAGHYA
jgi:prepilin peptidase CpaA